MGDSGGEWKESKLAVLRKRRGLTQEDMIRATGISRSTYRQGESTTDAAMCLREAVLSALR